MMKRMKYGVIVTGERSHGEKLTDAEKMAMHQDLRIGKSVNETAIKYRCSSRVVSKYRSMWFGDPVRLEGDDIHRAPWHSLPKPKVPEHAPIPEPHVIAGITKAMLMGGRAPVAKLRRREGSDV